MYQPVIDFDVPLADFTPTFTSLEDRVAAAMASLVDTDSVPQADEISEIDRNLARDIFTGARIPSDTELSSPPVIAHLAGLLQEYDHVVVKSAAQLRTYVTNKLVFESANPDARIRLRALEMLGKISDVGLFTDKSEVTLRHRPTEELEQLLRERLTKVIEGDFSEPTPETPQISDQNREN